MKKNLLLIIGLCMMIVTCLTSVSALTLYANITNPACNDTATRTLVAARTYDWCSFRSVLNNVSDGDVVYMDDGLYNVTGSGYSLSHRNFTSGVTITSLRPRGAEITGMTSALYKATWNNQSGITGAAFWNLSTGATSATLMSVMRNGTNETYFIYDTYAELVNTSNPEGCLFNTTPDYIYCRFDNTSYNPSNDNWIISKVAILTLSNVSGLTLANLTFLGGIKGIYQSATTPGDNDNFTGNQFIGYGAGSGIDIRGGNNIKIKLNYFEQRPSDTWDWTSVKNSDMENYAVYLNNLGTGIEVSNNTIQYAANGILPISTATGKFSDMIIAYNTINYTIDDALEPEGIMDGIYIHDNTLLNAFTGISIAPLNCSNQDTCRIENNIIDSNHSRLFTYNSYSMSECFKIDSEYAYNINFSHNTCYGKGIYATSSNSQKNNTWIDNLFYGATSGTSGRNIDKSGLAADDVFYDYNLYYNSMGGELFKYWGNDSDTTLIYNLTQAFLLPWYDGLWDVGSLVGNPDFADASNFNFTPQNSTVCTMSSTGSYVGAVPCTGTIPDTTPPVVNMLNVSFNFTTLEPVLAFNASDGVSSNLSCALYLNDTSKATNTSVWNNTLTTLTSSALSSLGSYSAYINCTDSAGNTGKSSTILINLTDTQAPTVTLLNASFNSTINNHVIGFNYTDYWSTNANCIAYISEIANITNSSTINNTKTYLNHTFIDGIYTYYINCTDGSGNIGKSNEITIGIDINPPNVTIHNTSTHMIPHNATSASIAYNFTDAVTNISRACYTLSGTIDSPIRNHGINYNVTNNTDVTETIYVLAGIIDAIVQQTNTTFYVTCFDTDFNNTYGKQGYSNYISLMLNSLPTKATSLSITPSTAYTGNNLTLTYTNGTDYNGDTVYHKIRWFNGSTEITSRENMTTLTANYTLKGQTWTAVVGATDWEGVYNSTNTTRTISNTAPVINAINITPTIPSMFNNLTCNVGATDDDGDTISLTYNWTKNGADLNVHTQNLSYGNFSMNDNITCSARPYDGADYGVWNTSAIVNVWSVTFLFNTPNNQTWDNKIMNISWNTTMSGTAYNITYYNLSLLNSDLSLNRTIIGNNSVNTNYLWNVLNENLSISQYFIRLQAFDNNSGTYTAYTYFNLTRNAELNITARKWTNNASITNFTITITDQTTGTSENYTSTTDGNMSISVINPRNYTIYTRSTGYSDNTTIININQTYENITISLYDYNTLYVTYYYEDNLSVASGPIIYHDIISDDYSYNYSTTNGTLNIYSLPPGDYVSRYYTEGYVERFFSFTITDNASQVANLYLKQNLTSVLITVRYTNYVPIEGATVKVQKFIIPDNGYIDVESGSTDAEGQIIMSLTLNDEYYRFIVTIDGETALTTEKAYIIDNEINLFVSTSSAAGDNYFDYKTIDYNLYYDYTTNQFWCIFNDASNTVNEYCLRALYDDGTTDYDCTTASAGNLFINITPVNGSNYVGTCYVELDGDWLPLKSITVSFDDIATFAREGLLVQVLISIIFVLVCLRWPEFIPVSFSISLILGRVIQINILSPEVLGGVCFTAIIISVWLGRQKNG